MAKGTPASLRSTAMREMCYLPTFHLPTKRWCVELWPMGSEPQTVELPPEWEAEHLPAGLDGALGPGVYPLAAGVSMSGVLKGLKQRDGFYRRTWSGAPDWEGLKPDDVSLRLCPDGVEFCIAGRAEPVPWWWRLDHHLFDYGVDWEACRPGCHAIRKGYKPKRVVESLAELGFRVTPTAYRPT